MKNKCKNSKGITLIALVVTIVVLLILAGVTISTLTGDNGIITRANKASVAQIEGQVDEEIKLAVQSAKMFSEEMATKSETGWLASGNLGSVKEVMQIDLTEGKGYTLKYDDGKSTITVIYTTEAYKKATNNSNAKIEILIQVEGNTFTIVGVVIPKPVVDESSITITQEDGTEIPSDGVEEGTKLKITFTASVEGGTISGVTPGTVTNRQVTYITDGTEKEITFTITGIVNGENSEIKKTISVKDKYEKTEINSTDISNNPEKYFGAEVSNYTVDSSVADSNIKWKIFYADGETDEDGNAIAEEDRHIFLIASDYIQIANAPSKTVTVDEIETTYSLNYDSASPYKGWFSDMLNAYDGSSDITDTRIKALNNNYFNVANDGAGYSSTSNNMKAVAYMLDTSIWNKYAMTGKAEYAIGGPTVELIFKSYNKTHDETVYKARAKSSTGYEMSKDNGDNWAMTYDKMLDPNDSLYVIKSTNNASALWLASPSVGSTNRVVGAPYNGDMSGSHYSSSTSYGFRPLVCLKSGIQLEKQADGTYHIELVKTGV